jgi:hypothetical protein
MPMIRWFAEQVRKLYDVVPLDLRIEPGRDGVHHLAVAGAPPVAASDELTTRFRARADCRGGRPVVTATLTIGPVARVLEEFGTTVIDDEAIRRLADHELQQAFPEAAPTYEDLEAIGLFDPAIGRGWVIEKISRTASAASARRPW